jgi:hypothetical protein
MITLKQPKCDSAPLSNTGLDSQTAQRSTLCVRPDWIQGTVRFQTLQQLHQILGFTQDYTDDRWVYYPGRGRFCGKQWANAVQGINGSLALYNLPEEEGDRYGHCLLSFPASVIGGMDIRDVYKMMSALIGRWEFKSTRVDIALDDYSKRITFEMLDEAVGKKNYSGFRKPPVVHFSYGKDRKKIGWTFNFGNRSCDRVVRIYDKDTESGGRIKAVRIEAEFHDDLAQQVMADWIAIKPECFDEDSPRYLGRVVVGSIHFMKRTHEKNISRMPVLRWWQSIINKIGFGIRHTVKAVKTTYEQKKSWVNRQVSTTLAMFAHIMGMEDFYAWMQAQLKDGQVRLTDYHYAFIDHYKNQSASLV